MRIIRKVSFFILAILPIVPLIVVCFSMYRSGDYMQLSEAMTYLNDFITLDQSSELGQVFVGWIDTMSTTFGVGGECIVLALTYISYIIFLELTYMVLDVVLWIPRKLSYMLEMRT